MAGREFTERATVRVTDAAGRPIPLEPVRFEILGDTDALFSDGKRSVVLRTGADGTAQAPALRAGEKTGRFTVRATVVRRMLSAVNFAATVTARAADAVARTDGKALTAAPGAEFADDVQVKATYKGAAASGVAVTATMITSSEGPVQGPAANDKGPYFKDAEGKPVRTLTELKTDADGVLTLPKIFADDTRGTFLLRLTLEGGATVTIELEVVAPDPAA
jgi:hypothetical protein